MNGFTGGARDLAVATVGASVGGVLIGALCVAKLRQDVARLRLRLALARAVELECWLTHQPGQHALQIAQLAHERAEVAS